MPGVPEVMQIHPVEPPEATRVFQTTSPFVHAPLVGIASCHPITLSLTLMILMPPLSKTANLSDHASTGVSDVWPEKILKVNETRYEEAENLARMGHWEWDISENVIEWSDEVYRMYGFEPGEVNPCRKFVLAHAHPDDTRKLFYPKLHDRKSTIINTSYRIITQRKKLNQYGSASALNCLKTTVLSGLSES